jgi:ribosomal protein L19E
MSDRNAIKVSGHITTTFVNHALMAELFKANEKQQYAFDQIIKLMKTGTIDRLPEHTVFHQVLKSLGWSEKKIRRKMRQQKRQDRHPRKEKWSQAAYVLTRTWAKQKGALFIDPKKDT